jgi:hypothetical protein
MPKKNIVGLKTGTGPGSDMLIPGSGPPGLAGGIGHGLGLGLRRNMKKGDIGRGGGMGAGRVLINVDVDDVAPANASAEYDEDQMEAAIMLQGFNEMKGSDPNEIVREGKDGERPLSKRDQVAAILADRINNIPFYQKNFGIGGDTGRKVIGFQEVDDPDILEDGIRGRLPDDAIVPVIANAKTKSIGPMTRRASADPDDIIEFFTMSQLANMAKGKK